MAAPDAMPPQLKTAEPQAEPPQPPPAASRDRGRDKPSDGGAPDARASDATAAPTEPAALTPSIGPRPESASRSSRMAGAAVPSAPPAAARPSLPGADAFSSSTTHTTPQDATVPRAAASWAAVRAGVGPPRARSTVPTEVAQAISSMLDTGPTGVPAEDPMLLQIVLLHEGGRPLGRLELGSHSLRWTPTGAVTPSAFAARVEPALSLRVREGLAPR